EKGRAAIEGFLVGRALMYASVYYHKTVRAAEVMAQSAVERLSGYPEVARPLLQLNDGQLLDELAARSERSRSVAEGLLYRKLYKHVGSLRAIDAADRRRWEKAASNPQLRRAMEDRMSERLRLPPLSILLDLAGVREDPEATREWEAVALEENGRLTYPFRSGAIWPTLLRRPPTLWAVSVYADPRFASVPASRVDRALRDA
ncbi:MAG TPA: hypothetical protein VJS68_01820, partial [Thermoplasmata archaeon]|nr:hypothetical protein [Thermoplasmata archaeon]